jgi:hypothetical protein
LHTELVESKTNLRVIDRKIRAAQRELVPLTTGLIVKTKNDRFHRLRSLVRKIRKSATTIQSLWRRAIIRTVYMDDARDYWVECYDDDQGPEPYYYNTWTLVTSWKIPLAYKYFVGRYGAAAELKAARLGAAMANEWIEIEEGGEMYRYNVNTKEYVKKEK